MACHNDNYLYPIKKLLVLTVPFKMTTERSLFN